MEEIMLKGFSLRFSNTAVPVTAWNPLITTWGLTQEATSAPFRETNLGAEAPALPAQPLPTATLPALGSSHRSQLGTTQRPSTAGSDGAPRHGSRQQPHNKRARAAAIKQRWPSTPQLPASTASVNCPPLPPPHRSPAPTPTAHMHQGPGPPPRPARPRFLWQNRL